LASASAVAAALPPAVQQQFLPLPGPVPVPTTPAPLAPPINPGYAVAPPVGLSPILTQPGPAFPLPQTVNPSYPPLPLPGPIDQQKLQSYRSSLRAQQRELQQQGIGPATQRAREIQQQLLAPDPQ
jgi:hypothetical protein